MNAFIVKGKEMSYDRIQESIFSDLTQTLVGVGERA